CEKVVAFSLCMVEGDSLFWEYVGLDYAVALDLHLYYYTIRDMMNWAIANGYKWLRSTGLSYEPKFRMRHELDPLELYARLRPALANAFCRLLLPWSVPARYDKALRRFVSYRDLWSQVQYSGGKNPDAQYQNGLDFHHDWGDSHFFENKFQIGL